MNFHKILIFKLLSFYLFIFWGGGSDAAGITPPARTGGCLTC